MLAVLPGDSVDAVGHLNALASAGVEVHAVAVRSTFPPGVMRNVVIHRVPVHLGGAGRPSRLPLRSLGRRIDRAVFESMAIASARIPRHDGSELDLLRRWRSPWGDPDDARPVSLDAPDGSMLRDVMAAQAPHERAWIEPLVPWLAGMVRSVAPAVLLSAPITRVGVLVWAALHRIGRSLPVWLVGDLGGETAWMAATGPRRRMVQPILSAADGLLVQCERDELAAHELGFDKATMWRLPFDGGVWDVDGRGRRAATRGRAILLDVPTGVTVRPYVGLEGIRRCADVLAGYSVRVRTADEQVILMARALGSDLRMSVEIVPTHRRWDGRPDPVHRAGDVSMLVMAGSDLPTWAAQAAMRGAVPVVAHTSGGIDSGSAAVIDDPEDPASVEKAIRIARTSDVGQRRSGSDGTANTMDRRVLAPALVTMYDDLARATGAV